MLGVYSYNQIIKKTIVAFGTLFNNIYIKHSDNNGNDQSLIKVPIAYGPIQKFLARIEQKPDLRKRVAITLPRMSFELTSIQYDNSRKVSTMQTFTAMNGNNPVKVFMPVPYNLGIELNIITKYNDDMLQIIEQILPFFQPHFNLSIDLVSTIGEKRDVPMVIQNIQMSDNYEGSYEERRNLIYTINFIAKTNIFGPVPGSTDGLIKKVQVDYYTDTDTKSASRQLRYVATPRAVKDYNDDETTTLAQEINDEITQFEVSNADQLVEKSYIMIGEELMYIKEKDYNIITVSRAQNNTIPEKHFEGDAINLVNYVDDSMIPYGDEFDFNEENFDFGDGKIFSPSKSDDV